MRKLTLLAVSAFALAIAAPAYAHVTVQPNEAVAGSFSRFVVRVPTERDVPTTEIRVQFPPLAFLAFEDAPGWTRTEKQGKFDEPLEAFGQKITEGVTSVTWSGGEIGPHEFAEFGFSAALPEGEETFEFKAFQTYDGGEVVKWTGAPDSDSPAARISTYDIGAEEGQGELAVLASLSERIEELDAQASEPQDEESPSTESAADVADEDDDEGSSTLAIVLGAAGLALGVLALLVALTRRKP